MRNKTQIMTVAALACLLLASGAVRAHGAEQKSFPTPKAAVTALITAVKARAPEQVASILGPELKEFISTRDKWDTEVDRELFLEASRVVKVEEDEDARGNMIAYLGKNEWPFPAPLVKSAAGWTFDGKAAIQEIHDRQVGRNEYGAMAACLSYVDAQLEYFSIDHKGDGFLQFAQRINSTHGKTDGLYWSSASGEDVSPIGPFAAQAAGVETNTPGEATPLFGYYFKVLTAQGGAATGGARNYTLDGRMLTGFALVAWPAEYRVSGVSTFIVNQQGILYEKDLGPDSAKAAAAMSVFNPDSGWKKVE